MCILPLQSGFSQSIDSILIRGIDLVHQEQFEAAFAVFDSVISYAPDKPVGYFFKAAAYSNLASDYRNLSFSDTFYNYIDEAVEIGKLKDKSGTATAEDLFYYAGAIGFRGIYKSFYGDWWGAFKDGIRGKRIMERSFQMDPTNYDVYYGLGVYNYWRSAKTKILWWLPFFSDKRKLGVEQIYRAIENGKFVRSEAKYALLRIYDNENDFKSVLDLWEYYLKKINPDDPFALYYVGRALAHMQRYDEAVDMFLRLLDIFIGSPYYDPAAELDVYYNLGIFYYEWGRYDKALKYLSLAKDLAEVMAYRKDVEEAVENSLKFYKKTLTAIEKN